MRQGDSDKPLVSQKNKKLPYYPIKVLIPTGKRSINNPYKFIPVHLCFNVVFRPF